MLSEAISFPTTLDANTRCQILAVVSVSSMSIVDRKV